MRLRGAGLVLGGVCIGLWILACRSGEQQDAAKTPVPVEAVARVNGIAIPRDSFDRDYSTLLKRYEQVGRDLTPAMREQLKNAVVGQMVEAEVIRQQARQLGVEVSREEEEQRWNEYRKRYPTEEAFNAVIAREGTTIDELRVKLVGTLLREKVVAAVSRSVSATPEDVAQFYEKNKERFVDPEQIRVSQILIRVPPNAPPEVRAERKKRAEEALRKVKKKGADFAALAGEYDEGSSKVRGGDLGLLARNRLGKAVEEVVWPLKVGEVRLVETPNGFQIVKKTEQKESRPKTLDEMKDRIERMVLAQKRSEAARKVFTEWKSAAKIEVLLKGDKSTIAGDGVTVPSPSAEVSPSPGTS